MKLKNKILFLLEVTIKYNRLKSQEYINLDYFITIKIYYKETVILTLFKNTIVIFMMIKELLIKILKIQN